MKKIILFIFLCFFLTSTVNGVTLDEMPLQPMEYEEILEFNKPEGYVNIQGMAITDKYYVIAVLNSDDTKTALVIIDKETKELADLEENPIVTYNFGHANDMEYDSTTNEIYIINDKTIHVLDANTFALNKDIALPDGLIARGIAKDEKGNYYLRDEKNIYTYDAEWNFISQFSINPLYAKQGISYQNGKIYYTCYPNTTIEDKKIENIIYVYSEGTLENILLTPNDYGEMQAMEFDQGIPYLLFGRVDTIGKIYAPIYESVSVGITVGDQMDDNLDAALTRDDNMLELVKKEDGKYSFSPIAYTEPGKYQYIIQKISTERSITEEETPTINVDVEVKYDGSTNQLLADITYDKEEFKEEPVEPEQPEKPVIGDSNNNETVKTEVIPAESPNSADKSEVDNPQTGFFSPIYIVLIILGVVTGVSIYHKQKMYKI